MRGITTVEEANRFLRESYIAELNRKFSVPAAQPESAFVPVSTWTAPGGPLCLGRLTLWEHRIDFSGERRRRYN